MSKRDETSERTYQIGTVSSLTGIDAHTIRAWERRYGAIKPLRSETGRRQYDDRTIERLQLLKALVDCSEAIGQIAHLSDDALRERLARIAEHEVSLGTNVSPSAGPPRIALLAPTLDRQLEMNAAPLATFDVRFRGEPSDESVAALRQEGCDVVLLEIDRVGDSALRLTRACLALPSTPRVIVLYRFATQGALARLGRVGAVTHRAPLRLESVRRIVSDQLMIRRAQRRQDPSPPPPEASTSEHQSPERRLGDDQLARLLEISTALECECPNHLSSLVTSLVSFERYSRDCESRDEEDAAQHRRLAEGTAHARSVMERLLLDLCEHEGITL